MSAKYVLDHFTTVFLPILSVIIYTHIVSRMSFFIKIHFKHFASALLIIKSGRQDNQKPFSGFSLFHKQLKGPNNEHLKSQREELIQDL